jgi:cell division protein FtsA
MVQGGMVVGLDLGTTKICVVIAERMAHGGLQIIGVGCSPSEGLRRGVVVDVEKTVQSLKKAVQEAELMAGVEVSSVYAGIAGEHIGSLNSRGIIAIGGQDQEICEADRGRVIEAARAVAAIPIDREVLHVLTQEFIVDDQREIRDPVGMSGVRLEAEVHIVTGAVTSAQNICKSILRADIEVRDIVLEPLASSYAVLEEDEKEMGVCLVDIGGGTTDIALFFQGSVRHTGVIGLGGQNVTNDVAIGLRTSWPHAEKIKCTHGTALVDRVEAEDMVEVPGIAGRTSHPVPRRDLGDIIEPRMEEIFALVLRELQNVACVDFLSAGIVLTGGGALLDGAVELAEKVFEMPVRLGLPRGFEGMTEKVTSPIYATALGLVLYGAENRTATNGHHKPNGLSEGKFDIVLTRMKEWFKTLI